MANENKDRGVQGFFEDVLSPVGGAVRGALRGLAPGSAEAHDIAKESARQRTQASEVNQLLQTYRSIDPSQTEQRNQILQRIVATPTFQKFQGTVGPLAQTQMDKTTSLERIEALGKINKSAGDLIDDDVRIAIGKELNTAIADFGIVSTPSKTATGSQRVRLSSLFGSGKDALRKSSKGNIATKAETQAFADKFKSDASKMGVSSSAAAAIFGEKFDKEVGRKVLGTTFLKDDVFPQKSKASDFFADEAPAAKLPDDKRIKEFEDFAQVGTKLFPQDNTPKPRAALGITELADQQMMQELETAAPKELDIPAIAQQDPEAFKQILAALRKGRTPSGKKFTMKDALEMMGQL